MSRTASPTAALILTLHGKVRLLSNAPVAAGSATWTSWVSGDNASRLVTVTVCHAADPSPPLLAGKLLLPLPLPLLPLLPLPLPMLLLLLSRGADARRRWHTPNPIESSLGSAKCAAGVDNHPGRQGARATSRRRHNACMGMCWGGGRARVWGHGGNENTLRLLVPRLNGVALADSTARRNCWRREVGQEARCCWWIYGWQARDFCRAQ